MTSSGYCRVHAKWPASTGTARSLPGGRAAGTRHRLAEREKLDALGLGADGLLDLEVVFGDHPWLYGFTAMPNETGEGGGTWASEHFDDSGFQVRAAQGKAPMHVFVELGENRSLVEEGSELVFWR